MNRPMTTGLFPASFLPFFLSPFLLLAMALGQPPPPRRNEMLVPLNSTTALICEPVFNQGRPEAEEARWLHDGKEVARVNGHTNAVLDAATGLEAGSEVPNVQHQQDQIPEIGFLLIRHTQRQHEGDFWCERTRDGLQGERTRLRVAFLEPFPTDLRPKLANGKPERGQLLVLDCPRPVGVPPPIISWQFNGQRLTDFSALNVQMAPNGSLLVHNFSAHQSGFYACEALNFVAKSLSLPLFLAAPGEWEKPRRSLMEPAIGPAFMDCLGAYVRNGVFWFLIGCLATSSLVLVYILGALFLYRFYALRDRHQRWPRSLFAAPGFRKTVAPMAERMPSFPPAYETPESSSIGTGTASSRASGEQFDV